MPTFHNPTGLTLALREREALADRIVAERLTVIEDDPYGLLRFDGEPEPHLHRLLQDRGADELAVLMSLVLQERRAWAAGRLPRAAGGAGGADRGARHVDLRVATAARASAAVTSSSPPGCSSRTSRT